MFATSKKGINNHYDNTETVMAVTTTAIVCVTNDLTTDQRADRTCQALISLGFTVLLTGRKRKRSLPLLPRSYNVRRMRLWFNKGPFFYADYNIRLFFLLLTRHVDLIVSNDLDSLLACYAALRIKNLRHRFSGNKDRGVKLLHDCHEYFRGVPELRGRKVTTRIWKIIEDHIFPKLAAVTGVTDSVARLYHEEYGNTIAVIRNFPFRKKGVTPKNKPDIGIRPDQPVILYQGAVNVDRGLEEAIRAMKYLRTDACLLIVGTGDILESLKKLSRDINVTDRVIFTGQIPFQELHAYTLIADIGLSIEKDICLNYHYCLPNKLLDYIQAQIPVLVSPLPEMKAVVDRYQIGEILVDHTPEHLAAQMDSMLGNARQMDLYRMNLRQAAEELCWENEVNKLITVIEKEIVWRDT